MRLNKERQNVLKINEILKEKIKELSKENAGLREKINGFSKRYSKKG